MIEHRKGDLLKQDDVQMIAHQVNCKGAMRSGIAKQIRETYPDNYTNYRNYCMINKFDKTKLGGTVLLTSEKNGKTIANLFSQGDYGYDGSHYTSYEWFESCMNDLYRHAKANRISVIGVPYKIGCVRGGANWDTIYSIIEKRFGDSELKLIICKFDRG